MKPKAIIVDIDGCLANIDHRVHFVKQNPKDWESFYAEMNDDKVNEWCRDLMDIYFGNSYHIFLITGRPEKYREITERWLNNDEMLYDELYMRTDECHDNDDEIKKKIYEDHIKDKYDVEFAIEDRPRVIRMWRSLGLVCLQVNDKEF